MTYEEYRSNKEQTKKSVFKALLGKLFTIVIFVLLVITISNISPKFKNFIVDEVLNSTMDFSVVNKALDKLTNVFDNKEIIPVVKLEDECSEYEDGIKCNNTGEVLLKESGIVTFIGDKDKYGNTIVVQQSNGYYAWYGNIKENIKLYDYVEANSSIGTSEKEYYYVLYKDDVVVSTLNEN